MVFPCCDRFGCAWGSYVATKHFCVGKEFIKARGKCVATKLVAIERLIGAQNTRQRHNDNALGAHTTNPGRAATTLKARTRSGRGADEIKSHLFLIHFSV